MTPRAEPQSLLGRLVSDPWRKLVSVILAVGLWMWIDQRVTMTFELDPCVLELVDPSRDAPPGEFRQKATIGIPVSPRDYAEAGYFDPGSDDAPVTEIRLEFTGASQLIKRLQTNERISVELPPSVRLDAAKPEFEFSMHDLRFRDDEFATVLTAMHPARVKVRLHRKHEIDLVLRHTHLNTTTPGDLSLAGRLDFQNVGFSPNAIKLRGTITDLTVLEENLRKLALDDQSAEWLFDCNLERWANTPKRVVTQPITLRPLWAIQHGIETDPHTVQVQIPLSPAFSPFKLMIPVDLVTTQAPHLANAFETIQPVEVILSAASPLDAELLGKSEQQLNEWARENLCVLAVLHKDAKADDTQLLVGKLIFFGQSYREGTHYRVAENIVINAIPKSSH